MEACPLGYGEPSLLTQRPPSCRSVADGLAEDCQGQLVFVLLPLLPPRPSARSVSKAELGPEPQQHMDSTGQGVNPSMPRSAVFSRRRSWQPSQRASDSHSEGGKTGLLKQGATSGVGVAGS